MQNRPARQDFDTVASGMPVSFIAVVAIFEKPFSDDVLVSTIQAQLGR
jgi:hypothetical protein